MALYLGNISLIAALIFSMSSAVALLIKGEENKLIKTVRKWGPRLAAFSITLPLLLLAYYFLAPNFNYQYVFDRASAETHWLYRLSAMWAGSYVGGSSRNISYLGLGHPFISAAHKS
jgi:cytochrome c biogenesis factor